MPYRVLFLHVDGLERDNDTGESIARSVLIVIKDYSSYVTYVRYAVHMWLLQALAHASFHTLAKLLSHPCASKILSHNRA